MSALWNGLARMGFAASGNDITVSEAITGTEDGDYIATLTDDNGCVGTETITVNVNTPPSLSATTGDAGCNGESTGSIDLTVSDGASPYEFAWDNGEITEDLSNLAAGTYSVTVTDNFGCTVTDDITVSAAVNDVTVSVNDAEICSGGNATLTATAGGGSGSYTYAWSNSGSDSDINVSPSSSTDYTVTVTDDNGCTATATGSVTVLNMQVDGFTLTDGSSSVNIN